MPSPYKFVQPIAYEINTYPGVTYTRDSVNLKGVGSGWGYVIKELLTKKYLGASTDREDIDLRCALMKEAITKVAGRAQVSSASGCLKVFMAPEFYFRGTSGAYSVEDMQYLIGQLQAMVQGEQWRHWLFVFGSILASFEPAKTELSGSKDNRLAGPHSMLLPGGGRKTAILNVTLVQKGGTGESGSRLLTKSMCDIRSFITMREELNLHKDASNNPVTVAVPGLGNVPVFFHNVTQNAPHLWDETVDHLSSGKPQHLARKEIIQSKDSIAGPSKPKEVEMKYTVATDANQGPGKENQDGLDWKNASGEKYEGHDSGLSIFELEGITFGVEICLDHLSGRLKASPPAAGQKWVQMQLVPSAGAWIVDANTIATQGGVVFNCDGAAKSDVKLVQKDWQEGGGPTLKQRGELFRINSVHDGASKATREKCFQSDGRVRIYPSLRLPGPRTV